jgi:acetoacetyl-CoA synthetase
VPPGATFFPTASVNYAQELLSGGEQPGARAEAIIYAREDGHREVVSWDELRQHVASVAYALKAAGVVPGECVAAWLPNAPEAVVAMLAANSLGALFTSASPDFGPAALADRFAQVEPTVLVIPDAYLYNGRVHQRLPLLGEVLALLPSVTTVLVVPEVADPTQVASLCITFEGSPDVSVRLWPPDDAEAGRGSGAISTRPPAELSFAAQAYSDAGFVLYSSGTTGRPKCIVHSGLGLLLKHWTEHVLHCDIRPGDAVFYFTTCGWMMWNWLVGSLAVGATIVLYDGFPLAADGDVLWRLAADEGVTFFGASAKFYGSCRVKGLSPAQHHDLSRIRTVASTGSPLAPEDFTYLSSEVVPAAHLASISGGTDICGCFVLGDPTRPVYAGEIQGPALGVDVDVIDDVGASLRQAPHIRGELVCRNVFPSMPLRFAGDHDGARYRAAYFEANPGLWTHGDFASWTEHSGIVISGRSDATLNAAGVRIGTAEIYRIVEGVEGVTEALAVGQQYEGDSRIVLFVRLAADAEFNEDLRTTIRQRLRLGASPRHVPQLILAAQDLPRTRSGKLAELAVSDVVNGRPVRNTHALANPEVLGSFADRPELCD